MTNPRISSGRVLLWLLGSVICFGGRPIISEGAWPRNGVNAIDVLRSGPGTTNHPVRVRPSENVRIPEGWPLGSDGSITCLTCHRELPSQTGSSDPQLRDSDGANGTSGEFCAKCHAQATGRTAGAMHWMAMGQAHVKPASDQSPSSGSLLDQTSRRCMGCHDGVNATEFRNTMPGQTGARSVGDRSRNHPVGVAYPRGRRRGAGTRLRSVSLVPARVRLPNGKVSCVSCHNLYGTGRGRLTVPIEDSALCFSCHDL